MELMFCHVDTRAGIMQALPVFPVSKFGIIAVFMCDGAMINGLVTTVADVGSLIETVTAFPYKVRTGLVAGGAGSAFHLTEDELTTHICFSAVITVDTEVVGIIKSAFMIPVAEAVGSDFLGDSSGIFAEISGGLLKRKAPV